jgi:ABC-2 type transport system ATP-binding protein
MATDNSIEVHDLVRVFKKGPRAVDGVSLRVAPGEIYGFLGPNGAGKSTTVHILTTLLPPTSGSAIVAGRDVVREGRAVRNAIGAALQEAALDPHLTGREHMKLQGGLHGLPGAEIERRGEALLQRVGLADAADRRVGGYSGGMKRRLDLALALIHEPRVLFLDEPTTGLDPRSRRTMWQIIRDLVADGVTIFLTTQNLDEADQLAGRIAVLDDGRLIAEGSPGELKRRIPGGHILLQFADLEGLEAAVDALGGSARDDEGLALQIPGGGDVRSLRALLDQLDRASIEVDSLSLHTPDLDDVFLTLTGQPKDAPEDEREAV